ncbi:MAG: CpaF family protein [Polaromonas sp.]|uniref:CpaF family protein n=1 Tax=Polaromonas sp. TaxID=1869339 RepID=UPI002486D444|nr:CpaF family protein [Polaromonas sp.]MDI1270125.1 CpaF family protein [Polaromonas sp.]
MTLRDVLSRMSADAPGRLPGASAAASSLDRDGLRASVHEKLLDQLNLGALAHLSPEQIKHSLKEVIEAILLEEKQILPQQERERLIVEIQQEVTGLGPLEPLLADPTVSDILVNNCHEVYVERQGRLELTPVKFSDDLHLLKIIDKIVSRVGRRIDESSPMVDARLPDGSRVNAIIPPLALDGPVLSIRRFSVKPLDMQALLDNGTLNPKMLQLLTAMVLGKCNILISGGTGSGKTTLLNALSSFISKAERVITIEDAAELQLQQAHVVRLETRPPNIEGKGKISQRDLLQNALRMRPDRIIVGEVRGSEVIDMLQAMNTGHEGSMTTVHANSPGDALIRLENIVALAGLNVPYLPLRQQMVAAFHAVIQIARLSDGKRKIVSIQEITGLTGETITMQEIFRFQPTGLAADGRVNGYFMATGVIPGFLERLQMRGAGLSPDVFVNDHA